MLQFQKACPNPSASSFPASTAALPPTPTSVQILFPQLNRSKPLESPLASLFSPYTGCISFFSFSLKSIRPLVTISPPGVFNHSLLPDLTRAPSVCPYIGHHLRRLQTLPLLKTPQHHLPLHPEENPGSLPWSGRYSVLRSS